MTKMRARETSFVDKWRMRVAPTPLQGVISVAIFAACSFAALRFFNWAVFEAIWSGADRRVCDLGTGGACWPFIINRWTQLVYGFYPTEQLWRPNIALLLLAGGVGAIVKASPKNRLRVALIAIAVIFPIDGVLLRGGMLGLELAPTEKWGGLLLTLVISTVGIAVSLPLGILLALGRRSKLPVIRQVSMLFIEFWRGVPLITVLFMASVMLPLFLPKGVEINKLVRALVGVSLFASAYMAEVIRGGLQAIPRGQYEAGKALGLSYWRLHRLIVLPQALRVSVPGIVNTFISLFKDTSLVLIIGMFDLLGIVQTASTDPKWLGYALEGYVFAGFIYWLCCFAMSRWSKKLEMPNDKALEI